MRKRAPSPHPERRAAPAGVSVPGAAGSGGWGRTWPGTWSPGGTGSRGRLRRAVTQCGGSFTRDLPCPKGGKYPLVHGAFSAFLGGPSPSSASSHGQNSARLPGPARLGVSCGCLWTWQFSEGAVPPMYTPAKFKGRAHGGGEARVVCARQWQSLPEAGGPPRLGRTCDPGSYSGALRGLDPGVWVS